MKFSKYFMMAGAGLLLAACSSEAPDAPNAVQGDEEGMMYISINVIGENGTRYTDSDEVTATTDEQKLAKLQLVIFDDREDEYLSVTTTDISSGLATFKVPYEKYMDMEAKYNRGAEMNIVVYANGTTVSADEANNKTAGELILHGSTSNETWNRTVGSTTNCFTMSNAAESKAAFLKIADGNDGKSKAKAWKIAADIQLSRLATRFDFGSENAEKYYTAANKYLELELVGFDVETHATSTYRLSTFSEDGLMPATPVSGTNANHCHYAPTTTFKYRVTEAVNATENGQYGTDYNYARLSKTNSTTYDRPNTVSTEFELFTGNETKKNFGKIPFAAIKMTFSCPNFAGLGWESESMKSGDDVLSVGGVFIGGYKDFKKLREAYKADNSKKFAALIDTDVIKNEGETKTEYENIVNTVDKYNSLLDYKLPTEMDATKTEADNETWFMNMWSGKEVFSNEAATGETPVYATYYAQLIINDKTSNEPQWYYGVSRNTAYVLTVNSVKYLGCNGDKEPGDKPKDADFTEMFISLNVAVAKWVSNFNNVWDL